MIKSCLGAVFSDSISSPWKSHCVLYLFQTLLRVKILVFVLLCTVYSKIVLFGFTLFMHVDRDLTAFRLVAGAGVFGVEMFLLADGTLLLNEIAPRPHNSGHYTIEACATSQYEQHLRAILGWPLGDTSLVVGSR